MDCEGIFSNIRDAAAVQTWIKAGRFPSPSIHCCRQRAQQQGGEPAINQSGRGCLKLLDLLTRPHGVTTMFVSSWSIKALLSLKTLEFVAARVLRLLLKSGKLRLHLFDCCRYINVRCVYGGTRIKHFEIWSQFAIKAKICMVFYISKYVWSTPPPRPPFFLFSFYFSCSYL